MLTFTEACEYLALSPTAFAAVRDAGLIAQAEAGYEKISLEVSRRLLALGSVRRWDVPTLAWYADLVLATEVGRSILLPISHGISPERLTRWIATPFVQIVLDNLSRDIEHEEGMLVALLRSLISVDAEGVLSRTALMPIVTYFERHGIPIVGQEQAVIRDSAPILLSLILVFTTVSLPISTELGDFIKQLEPHFLIHPASKGERVQIEQENLVAVDKLYASKAIEIHAPPEDWDFRIGVISVQRRTITLQMKVAPDSTEAMIDNIIDLIRPFLGTYGARVVHLLYEIANDAPYWRNPLITVDTNELLDRLGVKRTKQGFHHSDNRKRLRDALNTAHSLEIVGKIAIRRDGKPVTKAFYKTVLSLISAEFEPEEIDNIPDSELRLRGLPRTMQIRLNFYDGVRAPDGSLGSRYVLLPRLASPEKLPRANHTGAHELLKTHLFFCYRQTHNLTQTFTRAVILEKAGIRNKNTRQATLTLRKALDRLASEGIIESYSEPLPTKAREILQVTISASTAPQN